jgi:cobalamin biosynthesis protein CobD/CbiB
VRRTGFAGLPTPLKVLWTIWGAIVLVNIVVWGLASATAAHVIYPWPVWVAGPWGAVLLAVSFGVTQMRHDGRTDARRLPPGPG